MKIIFLSVKKQSVKADAGQSPEVPRIPVCVRTVAFHHGLATARAAK